MGAGLYRGCGFERVGGFEVRFDEGEVYSHEVMIRPARERERDGGGEQLGGGVHSLSEAFSVGLADAGWVGTQGGV